MTSAAADKPQLPFDVTEPDHAPHAEDAMDQTDVTAQRSQTSDLNDSAHQQPGSSVSSRVEPVAGPTVQPTLIGVGEVAAERKKGWWRR